MTVTPRQLLRRGVLHWYVRVSVQLPDGSWWRREKKAPRNTKADAQRYGEALRDSVLAGKYGKAVPTLNDFWVQFLSYSDANNKPSTAVAKKQAGRLHILPKLGKLKLTDVTQDAIERLKLAMLKDFAPATINNTLGYLHACLSLAVEYRVLERLPHIQRVKRAATEAPWLEPDEYLRFLRAAEYWPHRYPVIVAMGEAGLRVGEALALQWGDIDFERQQLVVRRTLGKSKGEYWQPKGNASRVVQMTALLQATLKKHRHLRSDFVFTTEDGKPMRHTQMSDYVRRIAKRAGLAKHLTNHSLRHTRTAILVMAGVDRDVIKKELGWSSDQMLHRYSHLTMAHREDQVRKVEAFLAASKKSEGSTDG